MKFLLDVCSSSRSLLVFLTAGGHDVLSAQALLARASDEALLATAFAEGRILVTEDKDFGELAVLQRLPHRAIVRMVRMAVGDQLAAMQELLDEHKVALCCASIITITAGRIRIRYPSDQ